MRTGLKIGILPQKREVETNYKDAILQKNMRRMSTIDDLSRFYINMSGSEEKICEKYRKYLLSILREMLGETKNPHTFRNNMEMKNLKKKVVHVYRQY